MRRVLLASVIAVLLAGCGSSSPGAPASPLASELSYFPVGSPIVLTIQTGPKSETGQALKTLQAKFPLTALAETAGLSALSKKGIDYSTDVKPLLGNPLAFGDTGGQLTAFGQQFLVVWITHDSTKLATLLHKLHGLQRDGSRDGASLYSLNSGGELAVSGPTVLLARTRALVAAALDRHAHSAGITPAQYQADTKGLDAGGAIQVFGDLQTALTVPSAATARRVPWVAAIRSYGVSLSTSAAGLTFGFRINTDSSQLSAAQIPIASGSSPAGLVSGLPIQVGIRDPAQIATFVLGAVQSASPHGYQHFLSESARIHRQTGVEVRHLLGELGGDLVIDSDTHTTLARAGVSNPSAVSSALAKLASTRTRLGRSQKLTRVQPGVFALAVSHRRALLGLVGNQLVLAVPPRGGSVHPAALHSFASAPAAPAAGANGSVSFRIALAQLVALASKRATQSPTARELLSLLGDLTGSMSATSSALTGSATLAFR